MLMWIDGVQLQTVLKIRLMDSVALSIFKGGTSKPYTVGLHRGKENKVAATFDFLAEQFEGIIFDRTGPYNFAFREERDLFLQN